MMLAKRRGCCAADRSAWNHELQQPDWLGCPQCGEVFTHVRALQQHISLVHLPPLDIELDVFLPDKLEDPNVVGGRSTGRAGQASSGSNCRWRAEPAAKPEGSSQCGGPTSSIRGRSGVRATHSEEAAAAPAAAAATDPGSLVREEGGHILEASARIPLQVRAAEPPSESLARVDSLGHFPLVSLLGCRAGRTGGRKESPEKGRGRGRQSSWSSPPSVCMASLEVLVELALEGEAKAVVKAGVELLSKLGSADELATRALYFRVKPTYSEGVKEEERMAKIQLAVGPFADMEYSADLPPQQAPSAMEDDGVAEPCTKTCGPKEFALAIHKLLKDIGSGMKIGSAPLAELERVLQGHLKMIQGVRNDSELLNL